LRVTLPVRQVSTPRIVEQRSVSASSLPRQGSQPKPGEPRTKSVFVSDQAENQVTEQAELDEDLEDVSPVAVHTTSASQPSATSNGFTPSSSSEPQLNQLMRILGTTPLDSGPSRAASSQNLQLPVFGSQCGDVQDTHSWSLLGDDEIRQMAEHIFGSSLRHLSRAELIRILSDPSATRQRSLGSPRNIGSTVVSPRNCSDRHLLSLNQGSDRHLNSDLFSLLAASPEPASHTANRAARRSLSRHRTLSPDSAAATLRSTSMSGRRWEDRRPRSSLMAKRRTGDGFRQTLLAPNCPLRNVVSTDAF